MKLNKSYGIGEKAFYDSFAGLIPCKVIGKPKEGDYSFPMLIIEITESTRGYSKGEQIIVKPIRTVPIGHVYLLNNQYRINTNFVWDLTLKN